MEPLDLRADTTFGEALKCVQYRLPHPKGFKPAGYLLALGLRYGMVGVAASHHLLITADDNEERPLIEMIESWPRVVEDHVRWELSERLPITLNSNLPEFVGQIALLPMRAYLPLYRRLFPLGRSLDLIGQAATKEHQSVICEGWPWFKRKAALKQFEACWRESAQYATHFFDRRQADLEEVPEIALIGE